ncbi:MAG: outer membrane protein assembly factor BamE [Nitrospinaceae bacterium]
MKRWFPPLAILIIGAWLLAGCGTVGKEFDMALTKAVVNGQTTKQEVRSMFGKPFKTGIQNGEEIWIYERSQYSVMGNDFSKNLIVVFNPQGIVSSHQIMASGQGQ